MVAAAPTRHDGAMNETQQPGDGPITTQEPRPDDGPDGPADMTGRLRTVADSRRPADDRLVAGVSTGIARHLDIDPVIVRILFGVLTFVGGAGVILYAAAWFLLPDEGTGTSVAADWFKLGANEEKVRVGGLVIAAVVAVLTAVGDSGWGSGWGWGVPWGLLPLALLVYVFVVRPRRRRDEALRAEDADPYDPVAPSVRTASTRTAERRGPTSRALTGLTLSLTAIAVAVTRIVAETNGDTPWTTYVAVALAMVGLGLLVSTFVGHGGPLIAIGVLLALVLAAGTAVPSPRIGDQTVTPAAAADVSSTYEHGVGLLELDLSGVDDPAALLGRTIQLRAGVGQTRVIVPDGLNVRVETDLRLGEATVFDRTVDGPDTRFTEPADAGSALTIVIDQKVGQIEVTSR